MTALEPRPHTVGVLLAGGVGRRVGLDTPKQLVEIAGKTIIEHTLTVFQDAPEIDEILVLMTPGHTEDVERLVAAGGFTKVSAVIEGGASRTETTWRALRALEGRECDVLLHDAVRPLLEPRIITGCVEALRTHRAVEVAIPTSDTIVVVERRPDGEVVREVPDRAALRRVQTPQGFRLAVIREAYERAFADPGFADRPPTDDCGVVLRYLPEVPIHVVPGSEHNMKVTHPVDVLIAERLFQLAAYGQALRGRTVVVLGEGVAVAELAARHGAVVFSFPATAARVEDPRSVEDALAHAAKESGGVDYVVSAAEPPPTGALGETDGAVLAEALGVTQLGPVNVARAALPYLRERRGHLLFHTASPYGTGRAGHALRSVERAAVVALTQALAEEWAADGVRVSCLAPEPAAEAPSREDVARAALDVLVSGLSGRVTTVRAGRTGT
ncbi:bifunctional cytidylyltransferase/SDR family oxidoreductase [Streptosporangium saharense]|uniref:bifunctional cytidylyltransferase/SDR family oxidoreductase n=1 Tax=Streptosporangium saharense TaxID=1706840 RepID=UPI00343483B1